MNPDVSVAPEIAQLMAPLAATALAPTPAATALTVGDLARQLKLITGSPDRWWHLVRFDPERPVTVDIPVAETAGRYRAWLTILPPAAADPGARPSDVLTVVAGELTEIGTRPLTPGRVRVHGGPQPRQLLNTSDGYTVSVHLRGQPGK
ncbi:MAG: cysteine dioxygenase [Actinobacteria bacterium]|nr:cysteine dioxygenase [Actinomycetota bacterium]